MLEGLFLFVEVSLHAFCQFLLGFHRFLDDSLYVGLFAVHEFSHLIFYGFAESRFVGFYFLDAGGVQRFDYKGV